MLPIAGEPDWLDVFVLVVVPVSLVIAGYLLLRRAKSPRYRRVGAIFISVIAAGFGTFGIIAYAVPALDDFRNPNVQFRFALVGNLVLWSICLGVLLLAFRTAWRAIEDGKK